MTATVTRDPSTELGDDDFRDILSHTRAFVRNVVVPREQEIDETDAIPAEIRAAAKGMGLFGFAIPQQCDGLVTHARNAAGGQR
ncbi:alkylation response protein AidB-like acyl-CoA dehydrogenase [Rhodococcus opacus]|nr:alkylation response protein AidB-like acyl-CoA dehydrogenase [Rhodococcus opacus]